MGRFQVIEYLSFFAVRDLVTGQEHPMGDGVDALFDAEEKAISPGTNGFCEIWGEAMNENEGETLASYFPEQHDQENGA